MTSSIQIKCPLCPPSNDEKFLENPEILCGHMAQFHDFHTIMHSKCFESFAHFQIWLSNIEDSRCDGGYLGSSQGPFYEDEYYLLCRRRPSSTAKRRRMSDELMLSNAGPLAGTIVTCTAFVHVYETMDGRVTVHYCLDHCGHSEHEEKEQNSIAFSRKRSNLKRCSPCAVEDDFEYQSPSMSSSPSSSVDFEDLDNNNYKYFTQQEAEVSDLNLLISQKLDSTADRLKSLTKILADLAMDIRNSDYHMVI